MESELDYTTVLRAALKWPVDQRALLAKALIDSLLAGHGHEQLKPSFPKLVGIGRGDGPAPTDERVRDWIDEYRTGKYGGTGR
jgi:hypothetical protein